MGLNQTDFGALLGVSAGAVCRWERKNRRLAGPVRKLIDQMQKKKARAQ